MPSTPYEIWKASFPRWSWGKNKKHMFGVEGWEYVCYFWFTGWELLALGLSISVWNPINIEIHLPFGFIRIGQNSNRQIREDHQHFTIDN